MSNEKQRLFRPGNRPELTAERVGRHRGDSLAFIQRVRRRARKQSERCLAGIRDDARFFMRWIADTRTLRVAWDHQAQYGGQVPGIDDLRYCDFPETQIWENLREERDKIRNGLYEPAPDRVVEISKGPGRGTRSLSLPCIHDRVVQRAVVEVLQPYLDPLFANHSFGFRPRLGVLHALAHARHYFLTQGRGIWVTADLRDGFHRVNLPRLLQVIRHYVPNEDVVEFIGRVLNGANNPGLRMGAPLSPFLLNLYLHHLLDTKWQQLYPDIPLLRYADDILLMCKTTSEARKAHDNLVKLLLPTGMLVKGDHDSDVVRLTPEEPALWLGFHIEKKGKKTLRMLVGEKSWESLAENLDEAHDAPDSPMRAWLTIQGWVNDKGPCFKYTNPAESWDRTAGIALSLKFDEIPDRDLLKDWWQLSHARWCRLRTHVAEKMIACNPKNSTAT